MRLDESLSVTPPPARRASPFDLPAERGVFQASESPIYANIPNPFGFTSRMAARERVKMFDLLMHTMKPSGLTSVIDVGVTSAHRQDSNAFERAYPHPHRITAVGIEDASHLETDHPGLRFVLGDGTDLPFGDHEFDLAVSFAVLEHAGDRRRQRKFIEELCRV